jgi:hypothetical protein
MYVIGLSVTRFLKFVSKFLRQEGVKKLVLLILLGFSL